MVNTVKRALEFRNQRLEEKRGIEKLRKQYHTIFARTTDLIQCINIREQFIYVNPACHNVICGYDGQEGLELFEKHDIPLVFTDISMPKLDGIEFLRRVKKTGKKWLM